MPDTRPTYPPCEWPADGHVPPSGYRAEKHDWGERCGRPGSGVRVTPPMAIVLWSAQVCQEHADTARRSRLQLWGPDGQPIDGAEPTPPKDPPTTMVGAVAGLRDAFADLVADMADALRSAPPKHRRANRPINVASLRQVIDELRAYADAAPPAEPLAPETALWTARLLDMPVGHLLAYAEQAGAERARDLGEIASECDDGTCPVAQAVHEALLDAGPWDRIDGDGSVASVLADHVTELGSWHTMGALLVANLDVLAATRSDATIGDTICQGTTFNYRAELGELFDRIADRGSRADETVDRLVVFCHGADGQLRRVGDVDPVALRPDGEPLTIINPRAAHLVETGKPTPGQPAHLTPVTSDRGFRRFPPVEAWHGGRHVGEVTVAESSAADGPHVWLGVKDFATPGMPPGAPTSMAMDLSAHLPLVQAEYLRDQLSWLIDHHYQAPGAPLVNDVIVDREGTRNLPHPYESLGENVSDGFCRRCGRDSRHELHAETEGWPWPYPAPIAHAVAPPRFEPAPEVIPPADVRQDITEAGAVTFDREPPPAIESQVLANPEMVEQIRDGLASEQRVSRPAVDIGPIADAVDHHTPGRLVVGVDPATDDGGVVVFTPEMIDGAIDPGLPDVTMSIIPADGGPAEILPAPTVETFDAEPDPQWCAGSGSAVGPTDANRASVMCHVCTVLVDVDDAGFLEQHPASDPI